MKFALIHLYALPREALRQIQYLSWVFWFRQYLYAVSKPCFSCRVIRYCEHISVKSYNRYVFAVSYVVMTLNYYAHATYESARDEFDRIMGATRITDLPKQEAERISA